MTKSLPQPDSSATRTERCILAFALLSGVVLMTPLLDAGPLVLDEHGSYWLVDAEVPGTTLSRSLDNAAIPPLSAWVQKAFLAVLGKCEISFRASSAACYLLAIAVTYFLGKQLHSPLTGALAAVILAWHPEAMDEVRIARCYGLVILTAAALLWVTVRWTRRPNQPLWGVAWGVAASAVAWTHYMALPLAGFALLSVPFSTDQPRRPARLAIGFAAALLTAALLCWPLLHALLRMMEWSPLLNYQRETQPLFRIIGPLWWIGAPAGLAVAWIAARFSSATTDPPPRPRFPAGRLILWSVLPTLLIAAVAREDLTSLANPRYRVAYAVPAACLLAGLFTALARRPRRASLATLVALLAAWSLSPRTPFQTGRLGAPTAAEWRRAALLVEEHGEPGDLLFVQSGLIESNLVPLLFEDDQFLEYVACRMSRFYLESPHPRLGLPFFWDAAPGPTERFSNMLANNARTDRHDVWVASATDTDLNRRSLDGIEQLLAQAGYRAAEEWTESSLVLRRYQPP
ncbi:MAG: hypothetical protein DWQ34_06975 [Planctomycetota bacterium]|nr:MAG: hypothetical protein DWQ34_06975 [Planctomycetota bacterium]